MGSTDDDVDYPEEPDGPRSKGRRSLGDRIRAGAATRPPPPVPARAPSSATTRRRIEGLESRERLFSFAAAGLAAVMGVVVYLVQTSNHHFRLAKGELTPQTTLLLGFLFAALLLGATLWGRRAPIGFVALFAFLGFGLPEGLPFLALAVWLLFRSYKFQKEAATAAKADRSGPSSSRAGTGSSGSRGGATRGGAVTASTVSPRNEANKRYTPKRPAPPPPKPSRRDRKAAKAAD